MKSARIACLFELNEGRLFGAKCALKPQQVWAIRFWLDHHQRLRDRALFDFAIDSELRAVQILTGHAKIESTVRYLSVDVEDGLELAERTQV